MKTLNDYISEALIKKDTKIDMSGKDVNILKEEIFNYLIINKDYSHEHDIQIIIENWLVDNNVKNVEYVVDPETYQSIVDGKYDDEYNIEYKKYNHDYDSCEECLDKLSKHCDEYKLDQTADLWVNNDMIAHIFNIGTIYCIKK